MPALEMLHGFNTAPGAVPVAVTMSGSDSRTIRNFDSNYNAWIIALWTMNQTAGIFSVRSPSMHDNVRGIYGTAHAVYPQNLLPNFKPQKLKANDTLTIELAGSAVGGDIEQIGMLIYYEDLPGNNANLINWEEYRARSKNVMAVRQTCVCGVAGGYSGGEAINAEIDLWKAGKKYALAGWDCAGLVGSVGYRGADTCNLRTGGPSGHNGWTHLRDFFIKVSQQSGFPCIPVFDSVNKSAIFIDATNDENAASPVIVSYFSELE